MGRTSVLMHMRSAGLDWRAGSLACLFAPPCALQYGCAPKASRSDGPVTADACSHAWRVFRRQPPPLSAGQVTQLEHAMRAKDREVAKAKEDKEAGKAAERERAKVGQSYSATILLSPLSSRRAPLSAFDCESVCFPPSGPLHSGGRGGRNQAGDGSDCAPRPRRRPRGLPEGSRPRGVGG